MGDDCFVKLEEHVTQAFHDLWFYYSNKSGLRVAVGKIRDARDDFVAAVDCERRSGKQFLSLC